MSGFVKEGRAVKGLGGYIMVAPAAPPLFDIKNDGSYEDRELDTHHSCDCSHF